MLLAVAEQRDIQPARIQVGVDALVCQWILLQHLPAPLRGRVHQRLDEVVEEHRTPIVGRPTAWRRGARRHAGSRGRVVSRCRRLRRDPSGRR